LAHGFEHANGTLEGVTAPGEKDLYLYFLDRASLLLRRDGYLGFLTGGGLFKNPAASGVRHFLISHLSIRNLFHFVNLNRLFTDLPEVVEFCLVVAGKQARGGEIRLAVEQDSILPLTDIALGSRFVPVAEPPSFFLRSSDERKPLRSESVKVLLDSQLGSFTSELHKSADDTSFVELHSILPTCDDARHWEAVLAVAKKGFLPLRGSRSFRILDPFPEGLGGQRSASVTLLVDLSHKNPRRFTRRAGYYRLVIRRHVGSTHTNERSVTPCVLSPGFLANDQLLLEGAPWSRPNFKALWLAGVLSSFVVDWHARRLVGTVMSLTILSQIPSPPVEADQCRFLTHAVLRTVAGDSGYACLWHEELGEVWREPKPRFTWPVLATDDERWQVRAAIDAVVADAYGLNREQYAHVLSTFSHKSYPQAPALCLAKFDELKRIGLDAFTKKYDPYWDIPLNESLPKSVIELPIPAAEAEQNLFGDGEGGSGSALKRRSTRKRR
jgi:hypothetical protein